MGHAVCTGLGYVNNGCPPGVYRSVWELLSAQLFGAMPQGLLRENNFPDVEIWKDSVIRENNEEPYVFSVMTDGVSAPKKDDIILYKGKFYVIGAVEPAPQGE